MMIQTNNNYKCNNCIHKNLCKYEDEYQKIASGISNNTIPEYFTININCKYFYNNINMGSLRCTTDPKTVLLGGSTYDTATASPIFKESVSVTLDTDN